MNTSATGTVASPALANTQTRILIASAAFVLGLCLFVTTGFAWPSAIHNATHDTRHSLGLPCH